jgi:hypothetical protein
MLKNTNAPQTQSFQACRTNILRQREYILERHFLFWRKQSWSEVFVLDGWKEEYPNVNVYPMGIETTIIRVTGKNTHDQKL